MLFAREYFLDAPVHNGSPGVEFVVAVGTRGLPRGMYIQEHSDHSPTASTLAGMCVRRLRQIWV